MGREKVKKQCHIYWFNIGCENYWDDNVNILQRVNNNSSQRSVLEMEQMCTMFAEKQDYVILRYQPDQMVLQAIYNLKSYLPEIIVLDGEEDITKVLIQDEKIAAKIEQLKESFEVILVPYAVTEYEIEFSKKVNCKLFGSSADITKMLNSKIVARGIAEELHFPVTNARVCSNLEELNEFAMKNFEEDNMIVVKSQYGSSAKGMMILKSKREYEYLYKRLKKKFESQSTQLLVETWYQNVVDMNYQLIIYEDGKVEYIEPKKQFVKNGIYIGSDMNAHLLTEEQKENYKEYAQILAKKLFDMGYRGVASIDSIITETGLIFPIIEINARFSLSTYISKIPHEFSQDVSFRFKYYNLRDESDNMKVRAMQKLFGYHKKRESGVIVYVFTPAIKGQQYGRSFILYIGKPEEINMYEEFINIS